MNVDQEIDKIIEKMVDELRYRIKKLIVRNEKDTLKQYIASKKSTHQSVKKPVKAKKSSKNIKK